MLERVLMKVMGLIYLGGILTAIGCMGVAWYEIYMNLSDSWLLCSIQVALLLGMMAIGLHVSFIALKKGVEFLRLD
ncbi:hypothetical protein ACVUNM_005141 [Raoultella ornithinolytica]